MNPTDLKLTYCSNIHAGDSWDDHFAALKQNFHLIKEEFSPFEPLSIGLRISNAASITLLEPTFLKQFKIWLGENKSYVFTLNGFPYGEFHYSRVKDQVHFPDWTTEARLDYTLRLINILAALLPVGIDGGISTSPLSYKYWFITREALLSARKSATHNIILVAASLIRLKERTGQIIHLDLEPEPDGLLETGPEFIDWYLFELLPAAKIYFGANSKAEISILEAQIREHICLCYDICHFAIGFENHASCLAELKKYKIKVGKLQISAALKVVFSPESENSSSRNEEIKRLLNNYNEPVYLHQVVAKKNTGELIRYRDLPDALTSEDDVAFDEWRIHFHVPVFCEVLAPGIYATQSDITEVLNLLNQTFFTTHLEVETYTWEVLPEGLKLPVEQSIIRELAWVKMQLVTQGHE